MTERLCILLQLGLAVATIPAIWLSSPCDAFAGNSVPEDLVKSGAPIRVIQIVDKDRLVIECVAGESFLARGGIKRMKDDGRWLQDGIWTNYWPKGTVSSVGEWKEGTQIGPWLFASEDGRSTVTNHPPFAAAVAVAQQTAPAASVGSAESTAGASVVATTGADPAAGSKNENGPEGRNAETCANQSSDATVSSASAPNTPQPVQEPISEVALWAKKRGEDLYCRGKFAEAYDAFDEGSKVPVKDDEFAASILLQKGLCRFKQKRTSDASSIWSRLRAMYSQTAAAPQSLLLEAEDPSNTGKLDRYYDEILTKYPKSEEAATVLQKRGQMAFEKKDYAKASEWWGRFASDFPNHKQAAQIEAKLNSAKLVVGGDKSASGEAECASLVQRADALYDKASYREALGLYQEIVNKYALNKEASRAGGRLAQCLQALGRDQEALLILQRMAEKNPDGAAEALGEIVIQASSRKMDGLRQRAMQQLLERYPNTFQAQQALFIAGLNSQRRNNRAEAEKQWSLLLSRYPETEFRTVVERQLGLLKEDSVQDPKSPEQVARVEKEAEERERNENRKRWEKEASEFENVYRNPAVSSEERAEAAFEWAERCFCLENYEAAVQQYQRVWEQFPDSPRADEAAFRAAQVWYEADQPQRGLEQSLFLLNRFPSSAFRPAVLFGLGNRHILYEGDLDKAWGYYNGLMSRYPQHILSEKARAFWAAVKKLSKHDLKEQVTQFVKEQQAPLKKRKP